MKIQAVVRHEGGCGVACGIIELDTAIELWIGYKL